MPEKITASKNFGASANHRKKNPVKWQGIVKIQRELAPRPDDQVLIYSLDNLIHFIGPLTPALLLWFKKNELKFYAEAELIGTLIHIRRKVGEQDW